MVFFDDRYGYIVMKKKLLIFSNSCIGLYLFRRELIDELQKMYEIIIVTPKDEKQLDFHKIGCKIFSINFDRRGINPLKDLRLFLCFRKVIVQEKPEYVVTYTIKPNIYGGLICRLRQIPYSANITGLGTAFEKKGVFRTTIVLMYKVALKKAKAVFFENSENFKLFQEENIITNRQGCLLNGAGVNLEWFSLQEYPHNSKFKFLFIGRVMKEKGVDEL